MRALCAGTNKKIPVKLFCGTLSRIAAGPWGMLRGREKPLCKVLRKGKIRELEGAGRDRRSSEVEPDPTAPVRDLEGRPSRLADVA